MSGRNTYDDVFAVIAWSLEALAAGRYPRARHDGEPWRAGEDSQRAKLAGQAMNLRGCLVEVRGDWNFYKSVFSFPQWNERTGICWRCTCTPEQVREFGAEAPWRQPEQRLSHGQFLARLHQAGIEPPAIFQAPFVETSMFRCDWLHVVDLGVGADFLGNLFLLLAQKLPGQNLAARVASLWERAQAFYKANEVPDRLQNLTPTMLRKRGANVPPKLRAGAAVTRALIPFAMQQARLLLGDDGVEGAAKAAAVQLSRAYGSLRAGTPPGQLADAARLFAQQYKVLELHGGGGGLWRIKPKMHLFQELVLEEAEPAKTWVYRDEDWGGTAARLARSRGGALTVAGLSKAVLNRFCMATPMPRFL